MNQQDIAAAIAAAQEMIDSYTSASHPAAQLYNNDDTEVDSQQQESYYQPRQSSLQLANPYKPYPPATPSAPAYNSDSNYSSSEVDDIDPLAGVSYANNSQIPPQPSPSFNAAGYVADNECIVKKPSIPSAVANHKLLATQMQYSTVGVVSASPQFSSYTDKTMQAAVTNMPTESEVAPVYTASDEPLPLPSEPLSSESDYSSALSDWLSGLGTDLQQRGLTLRVPSMPPRISSSASSVNPFKQGSVYDGYQWDECEQMQQLVAMR